MSIPRAATILTFTGSFRQAQQEDPTLTNAWQQALQPDERSERALANPLARPGKRRQKKTPRDARDVEKEEEPADGVNDAENTGETETEEEMLPLKLEVREDSLERQEPENHTCVESPDSTADREAFCYFSSHASGEAWPSHMRHTERRGKYRRWKGGRNEERKGGTQRAKQERTRGEGRRTNHKPRKRGNIGKGQ
ncbi:hypothetical protein NDU88_006831 [Pleurodeles waltl]|uniref:Uncharacterized protein n=1 Tax=Pleurodeles waltl TaxID=8319 RepID=A0AAV7WYP6_PLEWA|nr:hypothetical protein NDU88_006831 [Pleurodeles waltl]